MKLCVPDWRWQQVLKARETKVPPPDTYAAYVYEVLNSTKVDKDVIEAIDNIEDAPYRDHLVAFLLSGAKQSTICVCLKMSPTVLGAFKQLYMDTESFRHKMEKRRFAEYYANQVCIDENAKQLLIKGIIEGPVGIESFWNCPHEHSTTTPKDMYQSVTEMSYAKAISVRHASLDSDSTKEGLKWANSTLKALVSVDLMQFDDATDGLQSDVALEQQDYTYTLEEMGLQPKEVLN